MDTDHVVDHDIGEVEVDLDIVVDHADAADLEDVRDHRGLWRREDDHHIDGDHQ